ncbi:MULTISPECIES: hypothetical protein [Burkholderia]|uniref:Membrane protein n=1 Tax=Burkholderia paludis TaxID=1506587 RepID=A0A6P2PAL3_9BURK|nr:MULTISPECIES: hypothetical protein [Burkholderia]CAB3760198.1 hypothetical protein LMG30113_03637 [Burkholderia paludis]VWC05304.1 membrane protein [Burkholderia paludis]
MSTLLFSASVLFFSLNAFSVRATFAAYFLLCALAFLRAPTLTTRQRHLFPVCTYWLISTCVAFILSAFGDFYLNFYIKFVLIQTYIALSYWMFAGGVLTRHSLDTACRTLIYVHAAFFTFQLVFYLATGHFIDFDSYVRESDSEALYATKALSDSLISIRALGLYSEPSFYAMTVVPSAVILLLSQRRVTLAPVVAFATALLSFSIASMVVCAALCGLHVLAGRGRIGARIAVVAVALACVPWLYGVYDQRVNQSVDYDAVGSRTLVLTELTERDVVAGVFGGGLFWDERNNVGKTHLRGYQVRDSSFYIYLVFAAGAAGSVAFIGTLFVLFRRRGRRKYLLYLLPILLFKYHVLYGMLWLTILLFVVLADQDAPRRRAAARPHPGAFGGKPLANMT